MADPCDFFSFLNHCALDRIKIHSIAKPRSDQLKLPQIITLCPQACTADISYDGSITSSASIRTLMHLSFWNMTSTLGSDCQHSDKTSTKYRLKKRWSMSGCRSRLLSLNTERQQDELQCLTVPHRFPYASALEVAVCLGYRLVRSHDLFLFLYCYMHASKQGFFFVWLASPISEVS